MIGPIKRNIGETMHIFFAADDAYVIHLGVALISIREQAIDFSRIRFYVMDGGISSDNKEILRRLVLGQIEFIPVDNELFERLPNTLESSHASARTYYRYLIPQLKSDLSRAIYLDCDTIIRKPLDRLWQWEMGDSYLAASEDTLNSITFQWKEELGLKKEDFYFNAGVMVMNLKKMREDHLTEKFFEYTDHIAQTMRFKDQDVLNVVTVGNVVLLPMEWNVLPSAFIDTGTTRYSVQEIERARTDPAIIHFAGSVKPWQSGGQQHPLRHEYFLVLQGSPWKNYEGFSREIYGEVLFSEREYYEVRGERVRTRHEAEKAELERRVQELEGELTTLFCSRSWRLTAPLRALRSLFRRRRLIS